jgi:hypothetical protein
MLVLRKQIFIGVGRGFFFVEMPSHFVEEKFELMTLFQCFTKKIKGTIRYFNFNKLYNMLKIKGQIRA